MGLDMYLHACKKVVCPNCGEVIKGVGETEEIAYWRKAYAIQDWFSRHCANGKLENCEQHPVTKDQLIELRDHCIKVLNSASLISKEVAMNVYDPDLRKYVERPVIRQIMDNVSVAEELIPDEDCIYDENYYTKLVNTVEQIDRILEEINFNEYDVVYHGWW